MPAEYRRCVESWAPLHPGWEVKVWDRHSLDSIENDWVFQIDNPTVQADVARVEILLREGGIYLDADMEAVRNIGGLVGEADAFVSKRNATRLENAGFGAVSGHQWLHDLVKAIRADRRRIRRVLDMDWPFGQVTKDRNDVVVKPYTSLHLTSGGPDTPHLHLAYSLHHRISQWMYNDDRFTAQRRMRDLVEAS